ncbi:MAG: hypothetical protein N3F05_02415 [Candidatus Diapherotrites archaeon]|nr:hypothetical protein [Candidatus Diapherotrites archaeon]
MVKIKLPFFSKKKEEEEVSIDLGRSTFPGLESNIESPSPFIKDIKDEEQQDIFSELESQLEEDFSDTKPKERKEISKVKEELKEALEHPISQEKSTESDKVQQKTPTSATISSLSRSQNSLDERIASIKKELGLL